MSAAADAIESPEAPGRMPPSSPAAARADEPIGDRLAVIGIALAGALLGGAGWLGESAAGASAGAGAGAPGAAGAGVWLAGVLSVLLVAPALGALGGLGAVGPAPPGRRSAWWAWALALLGPGRFAWALLLGWAAAALAGGAAALGGSAAAAASPPHEAAGRPAATLLALLLLLIPATAARWRAAALAAVGGGALGRGAAWALAWLPSALLVALPLLLALAPPGSVAPDRVAWAIRSSPLTGLPHALAGIDVLQLEPLYAWLTFAQAQPYALPSAGALAYRLATVELAPAALLVALALAWVRVFAAPRARLCARERDPERGGVGPSCDHPDPARRDGLPQEGRTGAPS